MVPCPVWVKKTNSQQNGAGLGFFVYRPGAHFGHHTAMKDSAKLRSVAAVAGRKNNGAASVRSEVGGIVGRLRALWPAHGRKLSPFLRCFSQAAHKWGTRRYDNPQIPL
jgi:hypothetical protein